MYIRWRKSIQKNNLKFVSSCPGKLFICQFSTNYLKSENKYEKKNDERCPLRPFDLPVKSLLSL